MIALAEIAAWNAEQERAKAAYDNEPAAYAKWLTKVCRPCKDNRHARCTSRATEGGRATCRCWMAWHETTHTTTRRY